MGTAPSIILVYKGNFCSCKHVVGSLKFIQSWCIYKNRQYWYGKRSHSGDTVGGPYYNGRKKKTLINSKYLE